jgi:hypothetical protein
VRPGRQASLRRQHWTPGRDRGISCVIDLRPDGAAGWTVMPTDPEHVAISHVAQRLSRQFSTLDTDLVARVVWDTYRHFDAHPTRDVVPILVQDAARDRLRVIPTAASRNTAYRSR